MRGVSKKMFISILTSVIVFVTMVATTFAWVGIFTYANTDNFNLNLRVQDVDVNYFLTISSTGVKDSFSDTININDVQRQIIFNQYKGANKEEYKEHLDTLSDEAINTMFSRMSITSPSTTYIEDNQLAEFKSINLRNNEYFEYTTKDVPYLKFDLYLSVGAREGIQPTSNFDLSVYLTDLQNTLLGTINKYKFYNRNPFKKMPSANELLKSIPEDTSFNIDSKNAVRFAFEIYNPMGIDENDSINSKPAKTLIFHGGEKNPTLSNNVYDLGGNLPEDSNTALQELLVIRPNYNSSRFTNYNKDYEDALNKAVERNDTDLDIIEENSKIWDSPETREYVINQDGSYSYNYLGVKEGIQTKIKITTYLWFEGWDSDCLAGIQDMPITLNLTFTGGIEEE